MTQRAANRHLAFRIGEVSAAIPLPLVREVIESPTLVPVPGSREHVAGVILQHGVALPVYDLRRFEPLWPDSVGKGGSSMNSDASHLIVCAWGEALIGILGGGVDLLESPEIESVEKSTESVLSADYLSGLLRSGKEVVAVLDATKLFASLGVPHQAATDAREDGGEENPSRR